MNKPELITIQSHNPKYQFLGRPNSTDSVVVREIWCENIYEVFDGDVSDTGIVLDIGANIGAFSVYVASLDPNVRVFAYEPEPHNFDILHENIKRDDMMGRILISPIAIADRFGEALINNDAGNSSIIRPLGDTSPCRMIPLQAVWLGLDGLKRFEFVDVLKIDVEGAEEKILLDASHDLLNLCRYIVVEVDAQSDIGAIVAHLSETHQIKIVGKASKGVNIFARRY